jgi:ribosomal protein L29
MDMKELQSKTDTDLKTFINENREELRSFRFKASGSGMRDAHSARTTRKNVARAFTELNRRVREPENKA